MKIFTVEITVVNGTTAQAIFERADYNTALSAFHSFMASAIANDKCTKAVCQILTDNGEIKKIEVFNRAD